MSDINVGAITEALNDKMDRDGHNVQSPSAVVVEKMDPTADNNYTWYRKYADGWVEQGGIITGVGTSYSAQTMPVEMADTNYTLICNTIENFTGTNYSVAYPLSVTQFNVKYSGTGTASCAWEVRGMAA